ncbi:MAG: hypothetical protein KME32_05110 [Mojavia pulchra JT2-VF2]|uniref:Uncharacterized protein n=1 Tax=Mojavia pulchra JT2-VF2 TaxID=287848 RepID=A0A951PV57_9NOST|nr:hypothetical protein [Mojavia pulchra JT2-VF2]
MSDACGGLRQRTNQVIRNFRLRYGGKSVVRVRSPNNPKSPKLELVEV